MSKKALEELKTILEKNNIKAIKKLNLSDKTIFAEKSKKLTFAERVELLIPFTIINYAIAF